MRHDYDDHIGKIWNTSENLHRNYNIFIVSLHFSEIDKIFDRIIIRYINNSQHSEGWYLTNYMFNITVHIMYWFFTVI